MRTVKADQLKNTTEALDIIRTRAYKLQSQCRAEISSQGSGQPIRAGAAGRTGEPETVRQQKHRIAVRLRILPADGFLSIRYIIISSDVRYRAR